MLGVRRLSDELPPGSVERGIERHRRVDGRERIDGAAERVRVGRGKERGERLRSNRRGDGAIGGDPGEQRGRIRETARRCPR